MRSPFTLPAALLCAALFFMAGSRTPAAAQYTLKDPRQSNTLYRLISQYARSWDLYSELAPQTLRSHVGEYVIRDDERELRLEVDSLWFRKRGKVLHFRGRHTESGQAELGEMRIAGRYVQVNLNVADPELEEDLAERARVTARQAQAETAADNPDAPGISSAARDTAAARPVAQPQTAVAQPRAQKQAADTAAQAVAEAPAGMQPATPQAATPPDKQSANAKPAASSDAAYMANEMDRLRRENRALAEKVTQLEQRIAVPDAPAGATRSTELDSLREEIRQLDAMNWEAQEAGRKLLEAEAEVTRLKKLCDRLTQQNSQLRLAAAGLDSAHMEQSAAPEAVEAVATEEYRELESRYALMAQRVQNLERAAAGRDSLQRAYKEQSAEVAIVERRYRAALETAAAKADSLETALGRAQHTGGQAHLLRDSLYTLRQAYDVLERHRAELARQNSGLEEALEKSEDFALRLSEYRQTIERLRRDSTAHSAGGRATRSGEMESRMDSLMESNRRLAHALNDSVQAAERFRQEAALLRVHSTALQDSLARARHSASAQGDAALAVANRRIQALQDSLGLREHSFADLHKRQQQERRVLQSRDEDLALARSAQAAQRDSIRQLRDTLRAMQAGRSDATAVHSVLEDSLATLGALYRAAQAQAHKAEGMAALQDSLTALRAHNSSLSARAQSAEYGNAELSRQLEQYRMQDSSLRARIAELDIHRAQAEQRSAALRDSLSALRNTALAADLEQLARQQARIEALERELAEQRRTRAEAALTATERMDYEPNEGDVHRVAGQAMVYYAIGTAPELQARGLLEYRGSRLHPVSSPPLEEFMPLRRDAKIIEIANEALDAESIKVLTHNGRVRYSYHPTNTGTATLMMIRDPQAFWQESPFLIIQLPY